MIQTSYLPTMSRFGAARNMLKAMDTPPSPGPAPEPTPVPVPTPDIDFSKIDTPEKAALTPALNPAILVAAAATFAASLSGNAPMTSALSLGMGASTSGSISYTLTADPQTQSVGLQGSGTLGDQAFSETWALNTQAQKPTDPIISITGNIGSSPESLAVTVDQQGQVIHVDGNVGDVDVHQNISLRQGSSQDQPVLVVGGTLGGVAMYQELTPVVDQSNPNQASLNIAGTLGDKSISNTVTASVQNPNDPKSMAVNINANGNIAGSDFKMSGQLSQAAKA